MQESQPTFIIYFVCCSSAIYLSPNAIIIYFSIFYSVNKIDTRKLQSKEFGLITACCSNLATFPGISTAQAVAADDWEEKQPRGTPGSIYPPDQRTFQQDIKDDASTSGSQSAKTLGKRKISESNGEPGTSICVFLLPYLTWNTLKAKRIPCPC